MAELDPKIIEDLKTQHGNDLHLLEHEDVALIVKRPGKAEYRRFKSQVDDARRQETASEDFVRACCVYPPAVDLASIFNRRYGLTDTFASRLIDLAGLSKDATSTPL